MKLITLVAILITMVSCGSDNPPSFTADTRLIGGVWTSTTTEGNVTTTTQVEIDNVNIRVTVIKGAQTTIRNGTTSSWSPVNFRAQYSDGSANNWVFNNFFDNSVMLCEYECKTFTR